VHNLKGINLVLCVNYMQYVENSLHCFLVTFLCTTNLSLDILAKDCLLIRHLVITAI